MNMKNSKKQTPFLQLLTVKEYSNCLSFLYDNFNNQQEYV